MFLPKVTLSKGNAATPRFLSMNRMAETVSLVSSAMSTMKVTTQVRALVCLSPRSCSSVSLPQ